MYSYVYFSRHSGTIHHWYYDENSIKQYKKEPAPLYFYVQDLDNESTDGYKSIYGKSVKKVSFDTYSKLREAKDMYKTIGRETYESDIDVESRFILDTYSGLDFKPPKLNCFFIDIEVHSETGFPTPEEALSPITIITLYSTLNKKFYVLSCVPFDRNFKVNDKVFLKETDEVTIFDNEKDMLNALIRLLKTEHPDIISGWNSSGYETKDYFSNGYDIPYIINRLNRIFEDENYYKKLSPVGIVNKFTRQHKTGKEMIVYDIVGITLIDYLALYRKYHQGEQENFKLDHICKVENVGEKIKYEGTLRELYNNDKQKYCEYNIQDVHLLSLLDGRIHFMDMMVGICYNCKCLFENFSKTTKVLDGAFISRLMLEKTILPDVKPPDLNEEKFEGAYVKDPIPGIYDWVVSFDATSLYPSVMIQLNISPETKLTVVGQHNSKIISNILSGEKVAQDVLEQECDNGYTIKYMVDLIKNNNYCISTNGVVYTTEKIGIVSRFVKEWFDNRQKHKKLMKDAQKNHDENEEQFQKGLQHNYKILINSVYGYVGSKYSRLYDRDNAVAVTATGQEIIKNSQECLEQYFMNWENSDLGKKLKAKNLTQSPICYGDTDSIFSGATLCDEMGYRKTVKQYFEDLCKEFPDDIKIQYSGKIFVFPKNKLLPYFDEIEKKVKYGNVKYVYQHHVSKKMYRIKTKNGKFIEVTEDHSCMIVDKDGNLKEVKPKDIKYGDKIICIK